MGTMEMGCESPVGKPEHENKIAAGSYLDTQGRASDCLLTRACPASERSRSLRIRTNGVVRPAAGFMSQSLHPGGASLILASALSNSVCNPEMRPSNFMLVAALIKSIQNPPRGCVRQPSSSSISRASSCSLCSSISRNCASNRSNSSLTDSLGIGTSCLARRKRASLIIHLFRSSSEVIFQQIMKLPHPCQ